MSHAKETKGDIWTKISATSEVITGLVSNFFWISRTTDLFSNTEGDNAIGLSTTGIATGAIIAVFATAGSVYCHYLLNMYHQQEEVAELSEILIANELPTTRTHHQGLTLTQKLALAGDWVGHIGETSGLFNFIIDLVAENRIGQIARIGINVGITAYSTAVSFADVRTCWTNLLRHNRESQRASDTLNELFEP